MTIQVFVPKYRTEECLAEIKECLEKGWTGLGFKTNIFENKWRQYTGLPHAHFISSNTVGLHLALNIFKRQCQWQDGDEIITTPLTFISTNHAIRYENLHPVFADVDDSLCLDPNSIESVITSKTRAVLYVGIGGNTGKLNEVVEICQKYHLKLILDAAHMAGTRYKGVHVGQEADATVFSFQAVKNLPTADSGMICFKERILDEEVRKLSWLGINKNTYSRTSPTGNYKWNYDVEYIGFKYHGNSIMAALGLVGLTYLEEDNYVRRQLVQHYHKLLSSLAQIKYIEVAPDCESAQHLFQIRVPYRNELMEYLYKHDIFPGVHYRDNTEYRMYQYAANTCPNAHRISKEIISLPLHLHLTREDVQYICELIQQFYVKLPLAQCQTSY